jgi:hypothetical protein
LKVEFIAKLIEFSPSYNIQQFSSTGIMNGTHFKRRLLTNSHLESNIVFISNILSLVTSQHRKEQSNVKIAFTDGYSSNYARYSMYPAIED